MEKVEGINPVVEALLAGRKIHKILLARESRVISKLASERAVPVVKVRRKELDRISSRHQGVVAYCEKRRYVSLSKVDGKFFIILDELEDPQNLGSILRTADGAGVDFVIIPRRRGVGLTPAVAKVSAGAIEWVPVVKTNIGKAIDILKRKGVKIVGTSPDAPTPYFDSDLRGKVGIVIGSERKGIRKMVEKKCDELVNVPMKGRISCLNAAVVASILMYEKVRQESL